MLRRRSRLPSLAVAAALFWCLTRPDPLPAAAIPAHAPDLANGETLYHAGSCLVCHRARRRRAAPTRRCPSGGAPFKTPVGIFYPQNLTPDRGDRPRPLERGPTS